MFAKLLIANRGEIACRIARTARRLGIRTVAVFSDADAHSAHVAACDEAVHIGGPRPQESYLRGEVILEAARRTGSDAIHPGYGFLSENAEFAGACAQAGIVFVGPSPQAIAAMGSKSAAKSLMEKAGVPLTPGYHGDRQDSDYLLKEATRIGFPVLIKAVAGGGGKGMRRVDKAADFAGALASCQREAKASFKDDRVLVEKYLTAARHIEVQVFGDNHGNVVYLFERDCSVQRRHQKVIEEAPAPGMTATRRRQMGEAAVAAARAVNYSGAGTVEFIVEGDAFYFMEMNTRLQVEHPVTEMITGLDLVEWQLRVASGSALPKKQDELSLQGHAIEARVYAEDPARDFLPSIGKLRHLSTPVPAADVRIDTGVREGDEITPFYDPMIAKLIVHGETREVAIARMRDALAHYEVIGVATNIAFLARLMRVPSFVDGRLDTAFIERERAVLFPPPEAPPRAAFDLAVLALTSRRPPRSMPSPWQDTEGWRLGASGQQHWKFRCGDSVHALGVSFREGGVRVDMQGKSHAVFGHVDRDGRIIAHIDDAPVTAKARTFDGLTYVFLDGVHHTFEWIDPYLPESEEADRHGGLIAPMPGRIIAVLAKAGETVARGAPLIVMEAMKMEHTITAPGAGVIEKVMCVNGEQVKEGTELLRLAGAGKPQS
jgi:3-methylcrotonyl-CoA carboxylase alpha subunit